MKNWIKFTLLLASSLTVMSSATIAASLPKMAAVFSNVPNSDFLAKLILTIPALFIAVFSPIFGRLADKIGRLSILNISLVFYAFGGISGFFLDNIYLILVGRAVLGIAVAGIVTMAITLSGDYFKGKERDQFMGLQAAFMAMGGVIFVSGGGFLADISWRYPFLIYAFSLVVLIMSVILLKKPIADSADAVDMDESKIPKEIWNIFLLAFLAMVIFYMVPTQIPFVIKSIGIQEASYAGIAIAVTTLSASVLGLSYGKIKQFLSIKAIFYIVFTFMALGFFIIPFTDSFSQVIGSMILVGMGMGLLMPNLNTWLLSVTHESTRGAAVGLMSSSVFIGQFFSPVFTEPLSEYGIANIFGVAGGFSLIIIVPLVWYIFQSKALSTKTEVIK